MIRNLAAALATSTCIVALATPAAAQSQEYNIPAGSLKDALDAYVRQSGRQVVYRADEVRTARSPGVKGSRSPEAALAALLKDTGFSTRVDGKLIAIVKLGNGDTDDVASSSGVEAENQRGIAEILVVGHKSQNVDIRRTEDDPQPYVVFDSKDIEKSGARNLEEFFRTRLPMNSGLNIGNVGAYASSQIGGNNSSQSNNVSTISLRGLGANQTLVLVDGRRMARAQTSGDFTQSDINGIPIDAIERIEVLPSTAGGIYGGGAVGGVINIIRKRDYNGLSLRLGYDGAFRGGGETFRAELTGGLSFNHGRTQISFSASHAASQPLYFEDTPVWRAGREIYATNATSAPFPGATTNFSISGSPVLKAGNVALSSPRGSVPAGYAGVGSDGGAALIANLGSLDIELPNGPAGRLASLKNNPRVQSGNINIRQEIGKSFEAFADFTISDNLSRIETIPALSGFLSASDPGNPFNNSVSYSLAPAGMPSAPQSSRATTIDTTAGLIARLGGGWVATGEVGWSRVKSHTQYQTNLLNLAALQGAVRSGAIDVFRDINAYPIDLTPYISATPQQNDTRYISVAENASGRLSGHLFELPGGVANLTALLEHRVERSDPLLLTGLSTVYYPKRTQTVDSGYAELTLPLVSERNAMPLVHALELTGAVRHDRYSTRSAAQVTLPSNDATPDPVYEANKFRQTTWTVAGAWSPVRDIRFRASYATGFLPPSIYQIVPYILHNSNVLPFIDPVRNEPVGLNGPFDYSVLGNPDLKPEYSTSLSFGVIVTPRFLPGFRASADFTRIKKRDEIKSAGSYDFVLANEDRLPGAVVRDPAGTGPVVFINLGLLNLASSETKAWDFQADYTHETRSAGTFHLYAIATDAVASIRQAFEDTAPFDAVGFVDGPLKWRGNAGIDWTMGRLTLNWNVQYYDGYDLRYADPALVFGSNVNVNNQGGVSRIPSQTYHDLGIRYAIPKGESGVLGGLEVSATIQNLFDTKPPAVANYLGYSGYGDPRLRRYSLSVRKSF